MPLVPLIGFAPDAERSTPGAMLECNGLVPSLKGMRAVASNVATDYAASSEECTGAALLYKLDATVRFFIGGASKLQEGSGGSWSDVSKGGGYTASSNRWRFAQFGNDSLAVNKTVAIQRSTSTTFASLTAPKADLIAVAEGFVLAANCDDTGAGLGTSYGDQTDRWWCSGYNDDATWTPSLTAQCATGRLVSAPGPIRALRRLGSNVIAYKDRAIFVGSYVGASSGVWAWQLVAGDVGCASHEAVANIGTAHLFIGETDLYQFDGVRPVSLNSPLREWFFARLNRGYQYKIAALHDKPNGLVYWFYPSVNSASGALDEAIVYGYRSGRWGFVSRSIEMPIEIVLGGITYNNLGSYYTTFDDLPAIPYDSPFWISNASVPGIISTDHRPYTISGAAGAWSFASNYQGDDQAVSRVSRVRPRWVTKPASASIVHRYAMQGTDAMETPAPQAISSSGYFDVLYSARWHQEAISGTGEAELVGLDVDQRVESFE